MGNYHLHYHIYFSVHHCATRSEKQKKTIMINPTLIVKIIIKFQICILLTKRSSVETHSKVLEEELSILASEEVSHFPAQSRKQVSIKNLLQAYENTLILKTKTSNSDLPWKIVRNSILNFIAYVIRDKLAGDPNCGLFAVFDGHGGRQVSEHLKERMADEFKRDVAKTPGDLCHTIEQIFLKVRSNVKSICLA